jgi:hypothetical protein
VVKVQSKIVGKTGFQDMVNTPEFQNEQEAEKWLQQFTILEKPSLFSTLVFEFQIVSVE